MFSHQQYMNRECTHDQYYAQFVTTMIKAIVHDSIGMKAIVASTDKHLNDIPLRLWDNLHPMVMESSKKLRKEAGEGNSLSSGVCIAKAAARALKEEACHEKG